MESLFKKMIVTINEENFNLYTIFRRALLVSSMFILFCSHPPSSASESKIPKQFQSENAAEILGLNNLDKQPTKSEVKKAAKKLKTKYHPDKVNPDFSVEELTLISHKIGQAEGSLIKALESGNYGSVSNDNHRPPEGPTYGEPSSNHFYDEQNQEFTSQKYSPGSDVEGYSLRQESIPNSMFKDMPSDLKTFYINFTKKSERTPSHLVLVFHADTFPTLEARFIEIVEGIEGA